VTIAARPTTYAGIEIRSRLEAHYAAFLDATGRTWTYEPRAFANKRGQYLPDFRVDYGPSAPPVFVEVKPTLAKAYAAAERMQIIWDSHPNALLAIVVDTPQGELEAWPEDRVWRFREWAWR
jgi:hypothetical protein